MRKILLLIATLALVLIAGSKPIDVIRFTVVNKSGMDIAVQLRGQDHVCVNCKGSVTGEFYYLPVAEGTREAPTPKNFYIQKNTYGMQLFYIETWDPVYGFECGGTAPNVLIAGHNIRLTVLPCDQIPHHLGERSMWKYLPFPVPSFKRIWMSRMIY